MSYYVDQEAEESDNEYEEHAAKRRRIISDDEEEDPAPVVKKIKKRKRTDDDDEEEEEEEDEDQLREEMKDLINDDDVEEEEEEEESDNDKKHSRYDDNLTDEDYDLLEENLGVKVKRRKVFKRLKRLEDDEESDDDASHGSSNQQARDKIQKELFDEGGEVDEEQEEVKQDDNLLKTISSSEGETDEDDFIVDDDGQPITKNKKKHVKYTDSALQEAQDIFGTEFDFEDFAEDEYEEEMEEEYEDELDESAARYKTKKSSRKKATKKSIFDVYEPSELERGHFTDLDNTIKTTDAPERLQMRRVPVTPADDEEIEEEAQWIHKMAFNIPTISKQEISDQGTSHHQPISGKKSLNAIPKIREALKFFRINQLEVPFIAFYRKEYVEPDLNINDLWNVYKWDEKWCQLRARKLNLQRLIKQMQDYQTEQVLENKDSPIEQDTRLITDDDLLKLRDSQTPEEVNDIYHHFLLHYSQDLQPMRDSLRLKRASNKESEHDDYDGSKTKKSYHKTFYSIGIECGLAKFIKRFGLSAEYFGENLRDNYQRHEVDQYPSEPNEAATEFLSKRYPTANAVMEAGRYMTALQISRDPLVRRVVRQVYQERCYISIRPTRKGLKEIDENHPCYTYKYIKNKPIKEIIGDQFLQIAMAKEEDLLEYTISMEKDPDSSVYLNEIKQLYFRDEFSKTVQEWNNERIKVLSIALNKYLFPLFEQEITNKLVQESKDGILKLCCRKLYNWIKVAPYHIEQLVEEEEDYDTRDGLRILAIAFSTDYTLPAFGALIDGKGEVTDHIRLQHILKRKNAWKAKDRQDKEKDMEKLRNFISNKKPHVICVSGENRDALSVVEDIKVIVNELSESDQLPLISVELIDNELATVFMSSKKAESDFRDYPPILRQAVSLARRLQDPLIEFSQLCTHDEEILCLKYHPLQDKLNKDDLLESLYLEFINRTNEVGVDINRAVLCPHTSNLLQFVAGLGPRKAGALLKELKQSHQRLESRTQLVTQLRMGGKIFVNCAGFIKIDTNSLGDSTDGYIEVLDGSRVNPEAYEWARKMAVDALEYDDSVEDINPAGALEEILENPEKLKDLDLDAFAEELERQNFGNKSITLYDIRAELNHRYKDLRAPYRSPSNEEIFNMLTKETPQTFYMGKLVLASVVGIARRKPHGDQLDQANPIRHDETGFWQCPFCLKNDFPELSEVWNHFDAGSCPGKAMGVKTRLDNGVSGFIPTKFLSDKHVKDPEERVKIKMTLHCRIMKIDIERFSVDLTCKSSDLLDTKNDWRPIKDIFYDIEAEEKDKKLNTDSKKKLSKTNFLKRVIRHPNFHNVNFEEGEKLMANVDQGELIIRPSSKGINHLTLTWKVCPEINQHVDILEENKEQPYNLGKKLIIGGTDYEDLDEIIARYVQPMASLAREILYYKYYKSPEKGGKEAIEKALATEKELMSSKIHYTLSPSNEFPGKFLLSYLPRNRCKHEYVTLTPDGFRYRHKIHGSLNGLLKYFKEHFRDPVQSQGYSSQTPRGNSSYIGNSTPSINFAKVDAQTIQRAAASIPNHIFQQLTQVAGQTPSGTSLGPHSSSFFQPYTPSQPLATPLLTPTYLTTPTPVTAFPTTPLQIHRPTRTPTNANFETVDWKREAEQWMKKKTHQNKRPSRTPSAPDATPLIDEF